MHLALERVVFLCLVEANVQSSVQTSFGASFTDSYLMSYDLGREASGLLTD